MSMPSSMNLQWSFAGLIHCESSSYVRPLLLHSVISAWGIVWIFSARWITREGCEELEVTMLVPVCLNAHHTTSPILSQSPPVGAAPSLSLFFLGLQLQGGSTSLAPSVLRFLYILGDFRCVCMHVQLYLPLCDPMDCNPPGSSVHGIFQAKILEWIVISYSRGSSQPTDRTHVSCLSCTARQILYHSATWEAPIYIYYHQIVTGSSQSCMSTSNFSLILISCLLFSTITPIFNIYRLKPFSAEDCFHPF